MQLDKQKAIQELGVPEELFNELLTIFVQQTGESITKMEEFRQSDNVEEIKKLGHFIKGTAGNLRINEIFEVAKFIEYFDKEKTDIKELDDNIAKLKDLYNELKGLNA